MKMERHESLLKAKKFLGFFTLQHGVILISLFQIAIGCALYYLYNFLRPSLHFVSWSQLIFFSLSGILGFWSALARNYKLYIFYYITFLLCFSFLVIGLLDFSDTVHMLPKAPKGASTSFLNERVLNWAIHPNSFVGRQKFASSLAKPINKITNESINHKHSTSQTIKDLYDQMPFVPHLDETEKESEEVSNAELPIEYNDLSKEGEAQVLTIIKSQKRSSKLAAAGGLAIISLMNFYFLWITTSFLVNKCSNADELSSSPNQFDPETEEISIDPPQLGKDDYFEEPSKI